MTNKQDCDKLPSFDRVNQLFNFNFEKGIVTWKIKASRSTRIGSIAGCITPRGYICVGIGKQLLRMHRVIWFAYTGLWPPELIDHINGVPGDNRVSNLRLATYAQNNRNARLRKDNKTGFKGVNIRSCGKYQASCTDSRGVLKHLGLFATAAEAHSAYIECSRREHGEFARAS